MPRSATPPCSIAPSARPTCTRPTSPLAGARLRRLAQVPFKLIARRIADEEERRLVERIYDELLATGTVETHLPEDDRLVRDLHAAEVLAKRPPQPAVSKVFPFKVREPAAHAHAARPQISGDDRGDASAACQRRALARGAAPPRRSAPTARRAAGDSTGATQHGHPRPEAPPPAEPRSRPSGRARHPGCWSNWSA